MEEEEKKCASMMALLVSVLVICIIHAGTTGAVSLRQPLPMLSEYGPLSVTPDYIFVGSSSGLSIYDRAFNITPTIFKDGEVVALAVDPAENRVFYCYRSLATRNAECKVRATSSPFSTLATSANLMSGSAPTFTSSLSYNELIKSRVSIEGPTGNQPLTRYRLGVPVRATSGTVTTWVTFVTSGGGTGPLLTTLAAMVVSPTAEQPEVVSFAAAVYRPTTRYSYAVLTRRNVTTSSGTVLDTASFLARVCSEDVGANGAYPALLNNYGTYTEMTIPLENNAGTAGYYGNVVVDSSARVSHSVLFLLWSASPQAPASVMQLDINTRGNTFNNYATTCNNGIAVATSLLFAGYFQSPAAIDRCTRPSSHRFTIISDTSQVDRCTNQGLYVPISAVATEPSAQVLLKVGNAGDYKFISLLVIARTVNTTSMDIMLLGTATGEIVKASQVPGTQPPRFAIYEVRLIDPMRRPVTRIVEAPDSNEVLALANGAASGEVIRFSPSDCESLSCSECLALANHSLLQMSPHPYCAFCEILGKCTTRSRCHSSAQSAGLSPTFLTAGQPCPSVTEIEPRKVPSGARQHITVVAVNLPTLSDTSVPRLSNWWCYYPDVNMTAYYAATVQRIGRVSIFKCAPPDNFRVQVVSRLVRVALYSSFVQSSIVVTQKDLQLEIYDCSLLKSCQACSTRSEVCGWCAIRGFCRAINDSSCSTQLDSCPSLSSVSPTYINLESSSTDMRLVGVSLPEIGTYSCVLTEGGVQRGVTAARKDGKTLLCAVQQINFAVNLQTGLAFLTVSLRNTRIPSFETLVGQLRITGYSCGITGGQGCDDCLHKPFFRECIYCNSSRFGLRCTGRDSCLQGIPDIPTCGLPVINSLIPKSGTSAGGTVMTIVGTNFGLGIDRLMVHIGGKPCTNLRNFSRAGRVTCTTPPFSVPVSPISIPALDGYHVLKPIRLTIRGVQSPDLAFFAPIVVKVHSLSSNQSRISRNTPLTITGENLDVGGLTVVIRTSGTMVPCRITNVNKTTVMCVTSSVNVSDSNATLIIAVDGFSFPLGFIYTPDPTIYVQNSSRGRSTSIGGLVLNIAGSDLLLADTQYAIFTPLNSSSGSIKKPCRVTNDTNLECVTPAFPSGTQAAVTLVLDTIQFNLSSLLLYDNTPSFPRATYIVRFDVNQTLLIKGSDILAGDLTAADYTVMIGDQQCTILVITNEDIRCRAPGISPQNIDAAGNVDVRVLAGNLNISIGMATYLSNEKPKTDAMKILLIAVVAGSVFLMFVSAIALYMMKRPHASLTPSVPMVNVGKKWKKNKNNPCYGEVKQVDSMAIRKQLSLEASPFWNFQDYALKVLFPQGNWFGKTPMTQPAPNSDEEKNLKEFERLLHEKKFLVTFLTTLEAQEAFPKSDKEFIASHLIVALQNKLYYTIQVLKTLLASEIRDGCYENAKQVLAGTGTVADNLLKNWLTFCLYDHTKFNIRVHLYRIYHLLKGKIESGPVDALTYKARNCISEDLFLQEEIVYQTVHCFALHQDKKYPVQLLTCDTISQAKAKVVDATQGVYPASQRYSPKSTKLFLVRSEGDHKLLSDIDKDSLISNFHKALNTVAYYGIKNGSCLFVEPPHEDTTEELLEDYDQPMRFHLIRPTSKEVYCATGNDTAHLQATKDALMPDLVMVFKNLFDSKREKTPPVFKYLFDFIDQQAAKMNVSNPDVIQAWKNNSVPLSLWVNLIKHPHLVMDVNRTETLDACLSIVAEDFTNFCGDSTSPKLKQCQSTDESMFYDDEARGIDNSIVQTYYSRIYAMRPFPEQEMKKYLDKISEARKDVLSKDAAVSEIFRYAFKYSTDLSEALVKDQHISLALSFKALIANQTSSSSTPDELCQIYDSAT